MESAYCNRKTGECGLCAHMGALMYTVSKVKNACTTQGCPTETIKDEVRSYESDWYSTIWKRYSNVYQSASCKDWSSLPRFDVRN